tara:strand:- start:590 stop:1126 length:537 start_codon:yes stop_codon:yes gene_type:complete
MKTITKEYKLYTFDELSQEAKDKAREDFNHDNDYPFLADNMAEKLHELLVENKIKDENDTSKADTKPTQVLYSLGYSQGDGAMFEGTFYWKGYTVKIKHSGNYSHSNSKNMDIDYTDCDENAPQEAYDKFEAIYQKICKELEQYGYNQIEYEDSEEYFAETCEANEYTFLLSGKMMNE